jgi:histidinol-phosphate/aromatic aminotransferase/cobyric acid decarboxylase-like protein
MNFAAFQDYRSTLLHERSDVLDCAETNLYRALSRLALPPTPAPEKTVHRCHLAAEWLQCFALDAAAGHALVSCGVRDSLALLFGHYAGQRARVWLPKDNYPVYADLAQAAGLASETFPTLPEPVWPGSAPSDECELLLVTNPMKPRGRWLSAADVKVIIKWLKQSPRHRLLLDVVYTFATRFDAASLQLLATGQTILLHSLTKGWLHPRLFGIALVPEADAEALTPLFRAHAPPQMNLARAHEMLGQHEDIPSTVGTVLEGARERLLSALPSDFPAFWHCDASGYFMPVVGHWRNLLDIHRVLGIPASVFGSSRDDITLISSLPFAT